MKNHALETVVMVGMDVGRADNEVSEIVLEAGYFPGRIAGVMIIGEGDGSEDRLFAVFPA